MAITRSTSRAYKAAKEAKTLQDIADEASRYDAAVAHVQEYKARKVAEQQQKWELAAQQAKEELAQQMKINQEKAEALVASQKVEMEEMKLLLLRISCVVVPLAFISMLAGFWIGISVGIIGTCIAIFWSTKLPADEAITTTADKVQDVDNISATYTKPNLFSGR